MVRKIPCVILLCFQTALLVSCNPSNYPPEHVYQCAWYYLAPLQGQTVGPILPPVKKVIFYRLSSDNIWPSPIEYDNLPIIYETAGKEEIERLLAVFKEDLPDDFPSGKRTDTYFGMYIRFSTLESLFIPIESYETLAIMDLVCNCCETYERRSAELLQFMRDKGLVGKED
jgi:hypothetical protein